MSMPDPSRTSEPERATEPGRATGPGPDGGTAPHEDDASRLAMLDAWLDVPLTGRTSAVSRSAVSVHTSARDAFASFEAAVADCAGPDSLVVVVGWSFHPSTHLTEAATVGSVLIDAAARGVPVRALFTRFPAVRVGPLPGLRVGLANNRAATSFVTALPGGAAIHDGWLLHRDLAVAGGRLVNPVQTGVHHQKVWIVRNGTELRAWCGGVDFNPNRTDYPDGTDDPGRTRRPGRPVRRGSARHDVEAELTGAGAADLYGIVQERWNAHPRRPRRITLPPPPSAAIGAPSTPHRTRILTTYADPRAYAGLGGPPYPFAPTGSTAVRDFLVHAIDRSQRFIYLEDQYLVDEEIARHLAAAMPHLDALIMVISRSEEVSKELFQVWDRRRRFLAHLAPHAAKVATVASEQYVHAKTWVFDDEVALVSSANVNRRSMTHDSEAGVAFGDVTGPGEVKRMRERLWARHLGAAAPPVSVAPELSLGLWQSPPAGAPVARYDATAGTDDTPVDPRIARLFTPDAFWDQVVDPGV